MQKKKKKEKYVEERKTELNFRKVRDTQDHIK